MGTMKSSRCVEAKCNADGSVNFVVEAGQEVTCKNGGEKISVTHIKNKDNANYNGNLYCPDNLERFCISMN